MWVSSDWSSPNISPLFTWTTLFYVVVRPMGGALVMETTMSSSSVTWRSVQRPWLTSERSSARCGTPTLSMKAPNTTGCPMSTLNVSQSYLSSVIISQIIFHFCLVSFYVGEKDIGTLTCYTFHFNASWCPPYVLEHVFHSKECAFFFFYIIHKATFSVNASIA